MPDYLNEDLKTEELDAFLDTASARPRRLEGAELTLRLRHYANLSTSNPDPNNQLTEEYFPHRVLVLWRIARAIARVLGYTAEDETLDQSMSPLATKPETNPWYRGLDHKLTQQQQNLLRLTTANEIFEIASQGPIPLLPTRNHPKNPDPKAIERWFNITTILINDLNIYLSNIGQKGIQGLDQLHTCHLHKVQPDQILALEELLVDEAQRLIIKTGERPAVQQFRQRYGFSRSEALALMRLARAEALRMDGSTVEENRAIMSAQLKDFVSRAKESLNQRDELSALKELGRVQGLTRTEPEDAARDFFNTIARVAEKQDLDRALAANSPKLIEAQVVSNKRPSQEGDDDNDEYEDDDPEALRQFDLENNR